MINAGKEFRSAFFQLLNTFGGQVTLHKNFNCSDVELVEITGMKNHEKGNPSNVMFQFPERVDANVGDVIQQKGSMDYWRIHKTEDKIVGDVFVYFITYVKRIDSKGNPI